MINSWFRGDVAAGRRGAVARRRLGLDGLEFQNRATIRVRGSVRCCHGGRRGCDRDDQRQEFLTRPVIRLPSVLLCIEPRPHASTNIRRR